MRTILRSLMIVSLAIIFSLSANAQPGKIANNPWEFTVEPTLKNASQVRQIIPKIYQTAKVDLEDLKNILQQAPQRFSTAATNNPIVLTLPLADGGYAQFEIQEASIMHPELAAKFPEIQSYSGHGIDDPTASLRFDLTPKGFHAMIRSGNHSTIYIDPYATNNTEDYVIYFRKDFAKIVPEEQICHFDEFNPESNKTDYKNNNGALKIAGDCDLRTFRLALACTGEYAAFHGGTVAGTMAAMNTSMVRVNGIFEQDAGLTMELVPNNDQIIYTNSNTDPYTNNNGGTMLGQNQTTCDNVIGSANYDIGHVFSTGGGGVAYLQSPCGNSKAGGVTGQGSPVGDPFDVDYVAHEMGHQYGANHTQNNSCNRNGSTAMEPGSASTIMGYAGICAPNVQNNSDDHFHGISLQEMGNFIVGNNSNCAVTTITGNNPPTVTGGPNYTIPGGTKFMLTATGSDPDGSASLTYCWEQFDNEVNSMPPSGTNTTGPMFRSISPSADPIRYFPNIADIVNNVSPTWEVLPTVDRTMDFRVSIRDNNQGAGCTDEDDVTISVDGNTGPFLVTAPNTNVTWAAGSTQTVTWDVAGTTASPVNAANVDILLSTDGGYTYPITILTNVTNDGAQTITVPNNPTTSARIMVRGSNNVFFDISNQNFTIDGVVNDFFFAVTPADQTVCQPQNGVYTVTITAAGAFSGSISLSTSGLPAGATSNFSPSNINTSGNSTLTIGNTAAVVPGTYTFDVAATSSTGTKNEQLTITIAAGIPSTIALLSPSNGATSVSTAPNLTWDAAAGATSYDVEVSLNSNFSTLAASANISGTNYLVSPSLQGNTTYYWRVRGTSNCGTGNFSGAFSFTTANETCTTFASPNVPINISANGTPTITSTISIIDVGTITDVNLTNLDINHTYIKDLVISLTSPQGTTLVLIDEICDFQNNIDINLDDEASNTYNSIPCPPTNGDNYQPNNPLAAFDGENLNGTWILTIEDNANEDGGILNNWELSICYEPISTDPLFVTATTTDASCNGNQDGTATATAAEGTGNYTYSWDNGDSGSTISGLGAGTYTVTVDDGNNTASTSVTVSEPNAISVSVTGNDLDCNSDNSGTASANAGNGNFNYNWSNGNSGMNISNLSAGTYTVTATNQANQCTATGSVTLTQPDALSLEVASTNAGCNNDNGTASATTTGGTGNITFNWSTGQSGTTISGLAAGTYSITATDSNQCADIFSFTIGQTITNLSVSATATNANCDAENGTATASVSGGTGNITYEWSNGDTDQNIGNLAPGSYTVTATDANGCTGSTSVQVNQTGSTLQVIISATDASCGATDGTATADANGGTGGYTYLWNTGQTTANIGNLAPNTYSVTATDANGCTDETTVTIEQTGSTVQVSATATNAACSANNGTATADANGGTGGYTYLWNTGQTTANIGNLAPNTYSVTATDANGCTDETTVTIEQTGSTVQVSATATNAACSANNGTATADANGGTGGYTYLWNTGQTTPNIGNLAPNTYSVTATDANGCTDETTVTIEQTGSTVQVSATATNAACSANNGTATADANGGTGGYTYLWNTGQTTANIGNLAPNTYSVTATDANGCTDETTVTIEQIGSTVQVSATATNAACSANNGTATADANGGTGGYTYLWNTGQTTANIGNLAPNTYSVTATDANGCTDETTVTIEQTGSTVQVSATATNAACSANNGTATADANGGTGGYTYLWNTGQTTPNIGNLAPNTYSVTATDANGCTDETTVTIEQTGSTVQVSTTTTNESCGGNDGVATAMATGGNAPITYVWSNGGTSATISGLSSGNYTVTATDSNGCTNTATATVGTDVNLEISVTNTAASCFGGSDGTATVDIQGGSTPYTIEWSNGGNTNTITGLSSGQYDVIITDGNGCITTGAINITQPQPLIVNVSGFNANDGNNGSATANVSGGTSPYSYFWNTQATTPIINNLAPAVYSVVVTDANNCTATGNVLIENNTPPNDNYCELGGENTNYEWIESVTIANLNNPSGNNNGYGDFTGLVTTLTQGGTADVSLTPGFANTLYNENWRIWIDFNRDGDFADAGEMVLAPASTSNSINATINIPMSADLGETRMRITMKWGGVPTPCESFTYGEVEDYTVNITEGNGGDECETVIVNTNNFENGWGIWNDGGSDCRRSLNDANYANSDNYCVRLRDNTATSTMTTDVLNLSSFEEITIDFNYIARSMDNTNEDFWLQISTDGGQLFTTVAEWNLNDEFANGVREFDTVTIAGPFSTHTVFRFRCDASGNSDWVYLDDVTIAGCTNNDPTIFTETVPNLLSIETTNGLQNEVIIETVQNIQLTVYPNPVTDELTVVYQLPTAGKSNLAIYDLTGKVVFQQSLDNIYTADKQTVINVNQLNNGYYYLRIIGENESQTAKFLKL